MSESTVFIFNVILHGLVLGAFGWLLVCFCVRDARRRSHAAQVAVILAIAWQWITPRPPTEQKESATPAAADSHYTLPAGWQIKVDAAPAGFVDHSSAASTLALAWTADQLAMHVRRLWLAGLIFMILHHLWQSWLSFRWRSALRQPRDEELAQIPDDLRTLPLRVFDHEGGPCVAGLLWPVIAVPASAFHSIDSRQWRWLLRHENEHLRGNDLSTAWILGCVRVIGWWNPFVHVLIGLWAQSREQVCDAVALDGTDEPAAYAEFLLDVAALKHKTVPSTLPMAQSRPARRLRARLGALLSMRKVREKLGWTYLLSMMLSCLLGYALLHIVSLTAVAQEVKPKTVESGTKVAADTGEQFTRIFKVRPDFVGDSKDAKTKLTSLGVLFPEGSSAVFNRATSQLIVKNTKASLEVIERVVQESLAEIPQVYLTSRFIQSDELLGKDGEIMSNAQAQELLKSAAQKAGVNLLSAPSVTTRLGQTASVEIVREPDNGDKSKFSGVRLEFKSAPSENGRIQGEITATIGTQDGRLIDGRETVDWSKVKMTTVTVRQDLSSGDTLVVHLPVEKHPVTVLVKVEALKATGEKAPSFNKIPATPAQKSANTSGLLPSRAFDAEVKRAADLAAEQQRHRVYLTAKVVDIVQSAGEPDEWDRLMSSMKETLGIPTKDSGELKEKQKEENASQPPPLGVTTMSGVFTDPQFQVIIRALGQKKGTTLGVAPSATIKSGGEGIFALPDTHGGGKLKVTATIGPDGSTIDLAVTVLGNKQPAGNPVGTKETTTSVGVWDSQTIVLGTVFGSNAGGRHRRLIFLTAQIIDPNSRPVHPNGVPIPVEQK